MKEAPGPTMSLLRDCAKFIHNMADVKRNRASPFLTLYTTASTIFIEEKRTGLSVALTFYELKKG